MNKSIFYIIWPVNISLIDEIENNEKAKKSILNSQHFLPDDCIHHINPT